MKLSDLKPIFEAAIEKVAVEDLWSNNESEVSKYVSTLTYMVRPLDTKPVTYEVLSVVGTTSKPFGTFSAVELSKTLAPIRPNQTADAEGFTVYMDPLKISAFKYSGDTIEVQLENSMTAQLNDGDYVVKRVTDNSFNFEIEEASTFESSLKKSP